MQMPNRMKLIFKLGYKFIQMGACGSSKAGVDKLGPEFGHYVAL